MLDRLTTEGRNPASAALDTLSALEIARLMNAEDDRVPAAVGGQVEAIATAIDVIADRLRRGGRLVYLGAGTSGRLGVLDATECPPTFSSPPEQVIGLIAGGHAALTRAVEGAEDRPELAVADLDSVSLAAGDVLVGIATSGRTPYVISGLRHARSIGAYTIALSCNDESTVAGEADLAITPIVGPEILTGSTRLKAGTATKLVLNMLTTGAMVRLGKAYGNLMVDLTATNEKLRQRTLRIVRELTSLDESAALDLLDRCGGELKTAVVASVRSVSPDEARRLLAACGGHLRSALASGIEAITPFADSERATPLDLVLGIDAGGSSVVAWLARRGDPGELERIGRGTAGPANPHSVGWGAAIERIEHAVARAFAQADVPRGPVTAMCIAAAGVARRAEQQRLTEWALNRRLAVAVQVVDDAQPVLAAGTREGWGIAVIAGTGSIVMGRSSDGTTARAGGWGPLLGDEGSAYAIAVDGLRAAVRAVDGRGPQTRLVADLLAALNLASPDQLISAIYDAHPDRAQLARLAPVVTQAAVERDGVAIQIMDHAAASLAEQIEVVVAKLRMLSGGFPLALAGGVMVETPLLRESLLHQAKQRSLPITSVQIVAEPVAGAVKLAGELCQRSILDPKS
jgi:N-acetylmuramic acid 6-phosphate etherase